MRYWIYYIALVALVAGCSGQTAPKPDSADTAVASPDEGIPEDVMENIEMQLWRSTEAPLQGQRPLLIIRAQRVMGSVGSGGEWTFDDAEAVAPAQNETQSTISFTAASGNFIEDQRAVLEGGVTALVNDMTIKLDDITWEIGNGEDTETDGGRAFSDNPITIDSPTQKLTAASLKLDPETANFELTDVAGEIHFGGITQ